MALSNWIQHLRAALGVAALLCVTACRQDTETTKPPEPWPSFNADSAFEELENIVSFGSRAHGSPGHEHMAGYLQARLKAMTIETRLQSFTEETPRGPLTFNNIEAILPGTTDRIIILSTHYDSMQDAPDDFQAANSAGSGPAVLLELARILKTAYRNGPEIRFVFFDGQEPLVRHSSGDGLRGSSHHADQLVKDNKDDQVVAVINFDLVGDRDLSITIPKNVSNDLRRRLLQAGHSENARKYFKLFPFGIGDDHDPYLQHGIPAINIIDFEYGSVPGRNDYWRTPEDTIDKISPESLDIIGRVTLRMVRDLAEIAGVSSPNLR